MRGGNLRDFQTSSRKEFGPLLVVRRRVSLRRVGYESVVVIIVSRVVVLWLLYLWLIWYLTVACSAELELSDWNPRSLCDSTHVDIFVAISGSKIQEEEWSRSIISLTSCGRGYTYCIEGHWGAIFLAVVYFFPAYSFEMWNEIC